jgi:hypothetical protein
MISSLPILFQTLNKNEKKATSKIEKRGMVFSQGSENGFYPSFMDEESGISG